MGDVVGTEMVESLAAVLRKHGRIVIDPEVDPSDPAFREAMRRLWFAPEGDNHHNAAKCPHCTDNGRYKLIDPDDPAVVNRVAELLCVRVGQERWYGMRDEHKARWRAKARAVLSALADGDTP